MLPLAEEKAAAAQGPSTGASQQAADDQVRPPALTQKIFVVATALDVTGGGQSCTLTPGDIIQRRSKDPAPDGNVSVEVIRARRAIAQPTPIRWCRSTLLICRKCTTSSVST